MADNINAEDIIPVVGGGVVPPGPFSEWPDDITESGSVPVFYGRNWPEEPFDWHYGCSFTPIKPDD